VLVNNAIVFLVDIGVLILPTGENCSFEQYSIVNLHFTVFCKVCFFTTRYINLFASEMFFQSGCIEEGQGYPYKLSNRELEYLNKTNLAWVNTITMSDIIRLRESLVLLLYFFAAITAFLFGPILNQ